MIHQFNDNCKKKKICNKLIKHNMYNIVLYNVTIILDALLHLIHTKIKIVYAKKLSMRKINWYNYLYSIIIDCTVQYFYFRYYSYYFII